MSRKGSIRVILPLLAASLVFAASCGTDHRRASATLQVRNGDAGVTVSDEVPAFTPRTFGGARVCTTGDPVTINKVTFQAPVKPDRIAAVARVVDERKGAAVSGLISFAGTPEQFMADGNAGTLVPARGLKVNVKCPGSNSRFIDILVSARAAEGGAYMRGMTIHYTAGGVRKTVKTPWTYTFCGYRTKTQDGCVGPPLADS